VTLFNYDTMTPTPRDNNLTIIQLLLEAKHSISVVDDMKRTPLHIAIITASLPAVELLLESRMFRTILSFPIRYMQHAKAYVCVAMSPCIGASVHDSDKLGVTTLHYACRLGKEKVHAHTHIVRLLLKVNPIRQTAVLATPIIWVIW
jgi:ankyrin repeat protein